MLFSLLKHYLDLYITDTALKVSRSLYFSTTSIFHDVKNYFHRLWGTGISDAICLSFGGPVLTDRISNCPLGRVLTYKNLCLCMGDLPAPAAPPAPHFVFLITL